MIGPIIAGLIALYVFSGDGNEAPADLPGISEPPAPITTGKRKRKKKK